MFEVMIRISKVLSETRVIYQWGQGVIGEIPGHHWDISGALPGHHRDMFLDDCAIFSTFIELAGRTKKKNSREWHCCTKVQKYDPMAKQKGLIKIKGTIGNLSFYTTRHGDVVRTKWGPDKETRKNNPAFAAADRNSTEFGGCSASGKVFRQTVAELIGGISDIDLNTRVNSLMIAVKNLDKKSEHGKRNVGTALLNPQAIHLFEGFNFNKDAPLDSILKAPYVVDKGTGRITISRIAEKGAVKFPKGASHVCFSGGWARIDFIMKKAELKTSEVKLLPRNTEQRSIILKPKKVPKIKGRDFFILKIGFLQDQGGKLYVLGDRKYNSAAVVGVG